MRSVLLSLGILGILGMAHAPVLGAHQGTASPQDPRPLPGLEDRHRRTSSGQIRDALRHHRRDPRLWSALAGSLFQEGDATGALAAANVAARIDPKNPAANRVIHQLTVGRAPPDANPALPDHIGDAAQVPTWAWLLAALAAWWALSLVPIPKPLPSHRPEMHGTLAHPSALDVAGGYASATIGLFGQWLRDARSHRTSTASARSGVSGWELVFRDRWTHGVVLLSTLLGVWAYHQIPAQPAPPERVPTPPRILDLPFEGTRCLRDPAYWVPGGWEVLASCDGRPVVYRVEEAGARMESDAPGKAETHALRQLQGRLETARGAGFHVVGRPSPRSPAFAPSRPVTAEMKLCAAIAGAGSLGLLLLQFLFARLLWGWAKEDRILALGLLVTGSVVLFTHLGVPSRLVMTYTGYDLVERLGSLVEPPRYGAGATFLYLPWLKLLGLDHASIQVANRVMGTLTWLPVTALSVGCLPQASRRVGLLGPLLFAVTPLVWRDHTSEGIQAGAAWLLLSALGALAVTRLRERPGMALVAAVPVAAWAICTRPEVAFALVPAVIGLWVAGASAAPRRAPWLAAGALVLATLPHGLWVLGEAQMLASESAIAALDSGLWDRFMQALLRDNLLVQGPWVPGAITVWIVAGALLRGKGSLWAAGLFFSALLWVAVTSVDLPVVSIPRVHLPALLLLLPVAARGADRLSGLRFANPLLGLWCATSLVVSAPAVLAPGPQDLEDRWIRSAIAAVPDLPTSCVARLGFDDPPPPRGAQRHFPDYLLGRRQVIDLREVPALSPSCTSGMSVVIGTRCAMASGQDRETLSGGGLLPICTRLRETTSLETLEEQELSGFKLGSYRVVEP